MELTEFLLARIAEDEAVARAAVEHPVPADADSVYVRWTRHDTGWVPAASEEWTEGSALIARWDPARVLAECEAKRRIVGWFASVSERVEGAPALEPRQNELGAVLCALALPYADHPDYDPRWKV